MNTNEVLGAFMCIAIFNFTKAAFDGVGYGWLFIGVLQRVFFGWIAILAGLTIWHFILPMCVPSFGAGLRLY